MRLIDADALLKEFSERARAARNWKENAINNGNEEIAIRADATLAFLTEVKLTIEAAPTVAVDEEIERQREEMYQESKRLYYTARMLGVERPQGEWKENVFVGGFICSNCNGGYNTLPKTNFCPLCGARMKNGGST